MQDIDAELLLLDLPLGNNNASEIRKKLAGEHCTGKLEVPITKGGKRRYNLKKKKKEKIIKQHKAIKENSVEVEEFKNKKSRMWN